ncbi:hypothetical protein NHX12_001995 [Muraenolepis orangiensis]|uniref:Mannosidase endo-alpha like n=1 Tax=Muraenolepis orangiensis TaxID=630683 RepID=A0A9Q0E0R6_9TELE|nr:hypothetical protein NHX12_001995 [Muraenolepis orangiensis]
MARLRRKVCVALSLFTLFLLGTMMGLRTLKNGDFSDSQSPGEDLLPVIADRRSVALARDRATQSAGRAPADGRDAKVASLPNHVPDAGTVFYDVHIFYYVWYGTPHLDGKYLHWDHALVPHWDPKIAANYPRGRHMPPEDIGSSFFPDLHPYSSRDPDVLESHMEQIGASAAAYRHSLKVAFHIQPYRGRNDQSVHDNVKYIIDRYGDHGAFYKFTSPTTGRSLPMFYVYDSYLTPPDVWADLLTPAGSHSLRGSAYDALFIALIVEERHKHDILAAGFDGMYTYFASNGFSFGSSHQNWRSVKAFCDDNNLLFVPSVGPGYIDTAVRPWNNHNTRNRVNGRYYETALQAALNARPDIVAITSFNEWHEGTQIERAAPRKTVTRQYLDYLPHGPDHYLELTRRWAEQFNKEKEQWLM